MKLKLISEMPLQHHHAGEYRMTDNDYFSSIQTKLNKVYQSPKVWKLLSDKLSRLISHNIIIITGSEFKPGLKHNHKTLSELTKIPLNDFKKAITLIISDNNSQSKISPWLILHQLGEAITKNGQTNLVWQEICQKYSKYILKAPKFEISDADDQEQPSNIDVYGSGYNPTPFTVKDKYYGFQSIGGKPRKIEHDEAEARKHHHIGEVSNAAGRAFHYIFKMKSAREFIHGDFDNIDPDQEIITEYMWHGGRIRMNQPSWIPPNILQKINKELCQNIDKILTSLIGTIIYNNNLQ